MHIQKKFQNFLKLFLVGLHGDCTISLIAQDMSPMGVGTCTIGHHNIWAPVQMNCIQ